MASTYVVELTPTGRAAVAVVLVAGSEAMRVVDACFTPASGKPLAELPMGRIALGRWGGSKGEELIVCRRSEEEIEIHCHGGVAAAGAIIERLTGHGCRRITWRDWLRSTVGPSSRGGSELGVPPRSRHSAKWSRDRLRSAAQIALVDALTTRTAAVLLDQYHGALSRAIESAVAAIAAGDWVQAGEIVDGLLRYCDVGRHLTNPWCVVLAGAPNVGKSSLVNAVAGYQRAIVSTQPGTTRDVVTTSTAIAGWPVQLADTAGLRTTSDTLESAGVALAADALAEADLVIVVHDVTHADVPPTRQENEVNRIVEALPPRVRVLHVHNKIDLADAARRRDFDASAAIATSAVTGEGLAEFVNAIARKLVPIVPAAGAAVPFTVEQMAGLEAAARALAQRDTAAAEAALNGLLACR